MECSLLELLTSIVDERRLVIFAIEGFTGANHLAIYQPQSGPARNHTNPSDVLGFDATS